MFENLTERLSKTLRHLTGKATLSADNIQETLQEVRKSLLDADVALSVVDEFINTLKNQGHRATGRPKSESGTIFCKTCK